VVAQLPHVVGLLMSVSQPAFAVLEQCIQPFAHEVAGTEQTPALQVVGPLT